MKTSEMIAMLEKNPKLIFKSQNGYIMGVDGRGLITWNRENSSSSGVQGNLRLVETEMGKPDDWTLVPQPVPWQEALQARLDGKTVKVDCPDCGGDADSCVFEPTQDKESVCFSALKEGTFYIIEAPID